MNNPKRNTLGLTRDLFLGGKVILWQSAEGYRAGIDAVLLATSIKPKEICTLIMEESKAEVNPSQVILKDELNKLGLFQIDVNFHAEVKAKISIKIDKIKSK